jgi:hypothetical protein
MCLLKKAGSGMSNMHKWGVVWDEKYLKFMLKCDKCNLYTVLTQDTGLEPYKFDKDLIIDGKEFTSPCSGMPIVLEKPIASTDDSRPEIPQPPNCDLQVMRCWNYVYGQIGKVEQLEKDVERLDNKLRNHKPKTSTDDSRPKGIISLDVDKALQSHTAEINRILEQIKVINEQRNIDKTKLRETNNYIHEINKEFTELKIDTDELIERVRKAWVGNDDDTDDIDC